MDRLVLTRRHPALALVVAGLIATGCKNEGGCETDADCAADAYCGTEHTCFDPVIAITSPASNPAYANGSLTLEATVQGGTPERVEFLVDGNSLAVLSSPPFRTSWNTAAAVEGEHVVIARTLSLFKAGAYTSRLTVIVDRTPPTLVSESPGLDESNIDARRLLSVVFSEPILPASVNASSVSLSADGGAVAHVSALSNDGKTLTLTPGAFAKPARLEATLNGLTDLAGNALPVTRLSWNVPQWFLIGGDPFAPGGVPLTGRVALRLDSHGNPVVAFGEGDVVALGWDGTTWKQLGPAIDGGLSVYGSRSLALDGADSPVVALQSQDGGTTTGALFRLSASGWEPLGSDLLPSNTLSVFVDHLELDASGNPTVSSSADWDAGAGGGSVVHQVSRLTGSSWVDVFGPLSLYPSTEPIEFALDAAGSAVVVYYDDTVRQVTVIDPGRAELGGSIPIAGATTIGPTMVLDASGSPTVAFSAYLAGPSREGAFVYGNTGGGWRPLGAAINAEPSPYDAHASSVALDGSGTPLLAVTQSNPVSTVRTDVYRWTGSTWQLLGSPGVDQAGDPHFDALSARQLLIDSTGTPVVLTSTPGFEHSYVFRWNR
jgi:hypothetical protein